MERKIKVVPEQNEQIVNLTKEPFLLTKTQNKTLPLDMAEGDQRIIPDAGFLLQSVAIEKPDSLIPDNIVKDIEIGGVIGTYEGAILPELDNPASDSDVFSGKEYIDANGQKQTGSFAYPELTNPASAAKVFSGYEYIDENGAKQTGSFAYPILNDPASAADVVQDKEYLDGNGAKQTGSLNPNQWGNSFLYVNRVTVTAGTNSINTSVGVMDYLLQQAGVNSNRFLAFALRPKESYVNGEIGRCVLYPSQTIGYYTASHYENGSWTMVRMMSGWSAVLLVGSIYDIYYWSV